VQFSNQDSEDNQLTTQWLAVAATALLFQVPGGVQSSAERGKSAAA